SGELQDKVIGHYLNIKHSPSVGVITWFWSIEIIRRDLRNRITHEPDPEIPLGSNR
ncbi:hypothetical protein OCN78_05595, partial [Escherichia coli]|nr:hypothetical protein [Escherichia coli]